MNLIRTKMNSEYLNAVFLILTLISVSNGRINYDPTDGGYEDIQVVIRSTIEERPELLTGLKTLFKSASAALYKATDGKAFFRNVKIIVPSTWSLNGTYHQLIDPAAYFDSADIRIDWPDPSHGDEPYTLQPGGCGEPGRFIHLTPSFLDMVNDNETDEFGPPEKVLVREWAKFRYGVFEEHGIPGSFNYPTHRLIGYQKILPTSCVRGIRGRFQTKTGRPCKVYDNGRHLDPNCIFVPDPADQKPQASLMFSTKIPSIETFCNDEHTEHQHHDEWSPSRHNTLCGRRSVWEVIKSHPDFQSESPTSRPVTTEPEITIQKISNKTREALKVFLVLDTSGSMGDRGRINILNRAGKRFIQDLAPDGLKLGIVNFESDAWLVQDLTQINNQTKANLAGKMTFVPGGGTEIHKGVSLALQRFKAAGSTNGAVILLITDGNEGLGDDEMRQLLPQLKSAGIRLNAIAVGDDADQNLEYWTKETGGQVFYANQEDDVTNLDFESAFEMSIDEEIETEFKPVSILNQNIEEMSGTNRTWTVNIDPELGKDTNFFLASSQMNSLKITFVSPSGHQYDETDPSIKKSVSDLVFRLSAAEAGAWTILAESRSSSSISISFNVKSFPKDVDDQPIRVNAWLGKMEIRYPAVAKIFAEVKKGYDPVLDVIVTAIVERPNSDNVQVLLKDDGLGADVTSNDGIYSAYFTDFTTNGRYSVRATVQSSNGTRLKVKADHDRTKRDATQAETGPFKSIFSLTDPDMFLVVPQPLPQNITLEGFELKPINRSFARQQEVGGFKLVDYKDDKTSVQDQIPPSTVTDLQMHRPSDCDRCIEFKWTAAGEDSMIGVAAKVDLRLSNRPSIVTYLTDFAQALEVTDKMVIEGSLTNLSAGGSPQKLIIRMPDELIHGAANATGVIYAALITIDHANNSSPISNLVSMSIDYLIPPNRVNDFRAHIPPVIENDCSYLVQFDWTSAGDSGSVGVPLVIDLRVSNETIVADDDTHMFDNSTFEHAIRITSDMIVKGSLANLPPGGSKQTLIVRLPPNFPWINLTSPPNLAAALVTIDHAGNRSPISNLAAIPTLPCQPHKSLSPSNEPATAFSIVISSLILMAINHILLS